MRRIFLILLLASLLTKGMSQEVLLPLQSSAKITAKKGGTEALKLPFFDDFSYHRTTPNPDNWTNNYVFINDGYAKNARTPGVASFDALNELGAIYEHITYKEVFQADTLTSQSIDLTDKAGVVLSFLYQGGGIADAPEESDSLVLQFYASSKEEWVSVWKVNGEHHDFFQEAYVAVSDPSFLNDQFQFRFVNYVSLGSVENATQVSNNDVWNLDYVYLDENREMGKTELEDIAFTKAMTSFLIGYQSVPWSHFKNNPTQLMSQKLYANIENFGQSQKVVNALNYEFIDVWGTKPTETLKAGNYNIQPADVFVKEFPNKSYLFTSSNADSAFIQVKNELILDKTDFWPDNNMVTYDQIFRDYYAYDDGTAESGYGLKGNGSANAQVAYRFENSKPGDELWGVDIFLIRTIEAANLKYFYIVVWEDDGGKPGEELYRQPLAESLAYTNGLNKFSTFRLHEENNDQADTSVVVESSFFIGWEQTVEGLLGVGYDRNNLTNDKLFYSTSNVWQSSAFAGSLMLRPVFRQRPRSIPTGLEQPLYSELVLYPNPADNIVTWNNGERSSRAELKIYDLSGRLRQESILQNNESEFSVVNLPDGLYFVRALNKGRLLGQSKLLIQHRR